VSEAAGTNYTHVFVTTKALPEIAPTPALLAPLLSHKRVSDAPLPVFVILQNGISVEKDLYDAVQRLDRGEPKIISTALWIGTNLLPGNIISHVMQVWNWVFTLS